MVVFKWVIVGCNKGCCFQLLVVPKNNPSVYSCAVTYIAGFLTCIITWGFNFLDYVYMKSLTINFVIRLITLVIWSNGARSPRVNAFSQVLLLFSKSCLSARLVNGPSALKCDFNPKVSAFRPHMHGQLPKMTITTFYCKSYHGITRWLAISCININFVYA